MYKDRENEQVLPFVLEMCMRAGSMILLACLLVVITAGTAAAQAVEGQAVTGRTFACNFITPLEFFDTHITFSERGDLAFSDFSGSGFYFAVANAFSASYFSVNARIGNRTGDSLFLMTGTVFDSMIAGVGLLILEYSEIYTIAYFGLGLD